MYTHFIVKLSALYSARLKGNHNAGDQKESHFRKMPPFITTGPTRRNEIRTYLANGLFRGGLSSSGCAGGQGCGGLHNGRGHLGLHGSGCRLSCHRGRHFTNQSHISHYGDVGIIFSCHIQNFQAIVVKPRELALEGLALLFPANYYGCLAIEDCELTPCKNNITYMQKC